VSGHRALILRETAISVAINIVLSGVFFLALFGYGSRVPVRGWGNLAADSLPQAFAIGLMGSLVPGLLTRHRVRRGTIAPVARSAALPVPARALLAAGVAAAVLGGTAMALLLVLAPDTIGFAPALLFKLLFGAAVALIVTPPAIRAALREPFRA